MVVMALDLTREFFSKATYVIWLLVVVDLYPRCRWFADLKQHRSDWWLSYP